MAIYIVRHGEVPSNVDKIISGWNDEILTEKGIIQAKKIRDKLQNIDFKYVYSSPILRAKQTATIIVPNQKIEYNERLIERDPGTFLGSSREKIDKAIWNSLEYFKTKENAETLLSVLLRVKKFIIEKERELLEGDILIVTHMVVCKCFWMINENIPNTERINSFFQSNEEIKCYNNETILNRVRTINILSTKNNINTN